MTNDKPPVAPNEWRPSKDEPPTARQAMMQLDADIAMARASMLSGSYTIMPTKLAEALTALVPLADAVLDHADQHCRWFDISTAPDEGKFSVVFDTNGVDDPVIEHDCCKYGGRIVKFSGYPSTMRVLNPQPVMWHPPLPPPSTPPLPAVFVELGQALEKIKGAG